MTGRIKKWAVAGTAITLVVFATVIVWYSYRKTSLIDLQKQILTAETKSDSLKVLERLDNYYLNMPIPDSIWQRVQADVDTLIKYQQPSNSLSIIESELDTNIYQVEVQLKEVLRNAMIYLVRGDDSTFQSIMQYAEILADTVDVGTDNNYWRPWIAKLENYDPDKAMNWLLADRAVQLCKDYILTNYNNAEKFGAIGVQLLRQVEDVRLRLDIVQRLLVILSESRGMYDLSFPLAEREIQTADKLKYHLRVAGICYNYANALWLAGNNQLALKFFLVSIKRAEKYNKVPSISWYRRNGYLGTAKVNWHLRNYKKALLICDEVEKFNLGDREKIELHNTRGIVHRNLGDYDKTAEEYKKTLSLATNAKDTANQIVSLKNLGTLYYRLTEYDRADLYYSEAMKLLMKYFPKNIVERCKLLISFSENKAAQHKIEEFNHLIQEANDLIKLINLPIVRAELLRSLGRLNMKTRRYQQAYNQLQEALSLYEDFGTLRAALETKNDLVQSLIYLLNYQTAKDLLEDVYRQATMAYDAQRKIDALGMMAEIAQKESNLDQAIQYSNQLINEIESLSSPIKNIDNLIFFRQKIHRYLKKAVVYEIEKGRVDSAFVKLDYIKARTSKISSGMSNHNKSNDIGVPYFIDMEKLRAQLNEAILLINYLVTEDTLYTFVLDHETINLLKKAINIEEIRNLANTYLHSINNSINVLEKHQPASFIAHYDTVTNLSQRLYQTLLGWQELQLKFQKHEITYIIPDDILYGIPFSCLMDTNENNQQFLIQKTAIVNLPGAFFLQFYPNGNTDHSIFNKKVLVSADRNFPGANELVNLIKQQFPSAEELIIDKPVITKKDILSKLNEKYDIYFFIGHSKANLTLPDLSYFDIIAHRKTDLMPTNVKISLADFKNINWSQVEIVFLIGCETAIGKFYEGTGFCGFQQSLLSRGTKVVLASMWRIDAKETINQIKQFLNTWKFYINPALAIRETNKKTIERLQQDLYFRKAHPFIWGSFSLSQKASY